MKKLISLIFTIYAWLILSLFFGIHFIIAGIFMWFFKDPRWGNMRISVPLLRLGFALTGIKVMTEGLENIPKDRNFIIMSNHQSLLDILIFLLVIPVRFSFIAKKQLIKVPVLGWDIQLQGHFFINREHPRLASQQLDYIRHEVEHGRSLLLFPEGTRSPDGRIHPFKRGGFLIAQETGVWILPTYLDGTRNIIKKHTLLVLPGTIKVVFGPMIPIKKMDTESVEGRQYTAQILSQTEESIKKLAK